MKTVQVRFVVEDDEVKYSCLYIGGGLRGKSSWAGRSVVVESCSCPEISISRSGGYSTLFLRGTDRDRDELECCYSDKTYFLEMLPDILEALLKFDERYRQEWAWEKKSEIIINGEKFSFNTEEQKQIIKLLRIKI